MSYNDYPPATLPAPPTWTRGTHFRENLSQITVVPANVEKSKFSPDSPNGRPRPSISHSRMGSSTTAFLTNSRNLENGEGAHSEQPRSLIGRMTDFLSRFRRREKTVLLPIQAPPSQLPPWPPLHIEKRLCPCEDPKTKKRNRYWTIALIIVLLYLLGNIIALNIRVLNFVTSSSSSGNGQSNSGGTSSSGGSFALSNDQEQCLSQFTVNAPSNPSSFPCSSCLPLLATVPESFISTNLKDGQNVQNAIQFCGLQAVFASADSTGQQGLSNGGWLKDVKFCAWSGISCGGSGLVSAMYVLDRFGFRELILIYFLIARSPSPLYQQLFRMNSVT